MKFTFLLIILLCPFVLLCQKKFSLEANYGLNGNFFVRSYDQESRNVPGLAEFFYKKSFIGTIGGIELKYKTGKNSNIGIGYARSVNSRAIDFSPTQNIPVFADNFTIRHINNFYQLFYEKRVKVKSDELTFGLGIFYLRPLQQEVDISIFGVGLDERSFKNSRLEEGGFFAGFQYSKQIDTRFRLGIRSRLYYTASTNEFEAITLTPTLSYQF